MNNSYQAKSGLKTFILVFLISLGVFSLFYYLTSSVEAEVDIENYSAPREDVLGKADENEESPFEELSEQKIERPTVLAGADTRETTESTTPVPVTGMSNITMSLVSGISVLLAGAYVVWKDPRKAALSTFEKRITKD